MVAPGLVDNYRPAEVYPPTPILLLTQMSSTYDPSNVEFTVLPASPLTVRSSRRRQESGGLNKPAKMTSLPSRHPFSLSSFSSLIPRPPSSPLDLTCDSLFDVERPSCDGSSKLDSEEAANDHI